MKISYLLCILLMFSACVYHKGDLDPAPATVPPTNTIQPPADKPCDTSNVDYNTVIKPILQGNCYTCHSALDNSSGINFEDTAILRKYLQNDLMGTGVYGSRLFRSVSRIGGAKPMPPGGSIESCSLKKIRYWINTGAAF